MSEHIQGWSQQEIIDYEKTQGNDDGFVSEEEFVSAAMELGGDNVTEDMAREWYRNTVHAAGQDPEKGIHFATIGGENREAVDREISHIGNQIDIISKQNGEITDPAVFAKMDTNGDGLVNKDEFTNYVKNEMPGGADLPDETITDLFTMISNDDGSVTQEEFDASQSMLNGFQKAAIEANQNPPTEMESMIEILQELLKEFQNQNLYDSDMGDPW